jgi:hypothetical protein
MDGGAARCWAARQNRRKTNHEARNGLKTAVFKKMAWPVSGKFRKLESMKHLPSIAGGLIGVARPV